MPISPFEDDPPHARTVNGLPRWTRTTAAQLWLLVPMGVFASAGLGMWPEYTLYLVRSLRTTTDIDFVGALIVAIVFVFGGIGGLLGGVVTAWFTARFVMIALGLITVAVVLPTYHRVRRAAPWLIYAAIAAIATAWCASRYADWWVRRPGAVTIGSGGWLAGVIIASIVGATSLRAGVREFKIGTLPPVLPFPDVPALDKHALIVAHLSDLHLAASADDERIEGGASGNLAFTKLLSAAESKLASADVVLITGDITDGGKRDEWRAFFTAYPPELMSRTIVIPGNHDVNFTDTRRPGLTEDGGVLRNLRLVRMLAAMNSVQGDRAMVLNENNQLIKLSAFIEGRAEEFEAFKQHIEGETTARPGLIDEAWDGAFPQAIPVEGIVFFLLDSNPRPYNIIDNAIGEVSERQLSRLRILQKLYSDRSFVYVLHHHIGLPESAPRWAGRVQIRLLRLRNAREFVAVIPTDRLVAVFHGHRHFGYIGRCRDNVVVVSASSSTLGDEAANIDIGGEEFVQVELVGLTAADGNAHISRGVPIRMSLGPRTASHGVSFWQKIELAAQFVRGETFGGRRPRTGA